MKYGRLDGESSEYTKIRDQLHQAERELSAQRERVAELRRRLPLDSKIEDYLLQEGPTNLDEAGPIRSVRLSDLFGDRDKPLLVYQFMYGGANQKPCPMCSMWIDGINGVSRHLSQVVNFAVIAQADIEDLRRWGRRRGWRGLRLVSAAGSTLKTDLKFQNEAGRQIKGISVFVRRPDGLRHFYSVSSFLAEGEFGGLDLYTPVWNFLDLCPRGRGDWMPSLEYGAAV